MVAYIIEEEYKVYKDIQCKDMISRIRNPFSEKSRYYTKLVVNLEDSVKEEQKWDGNDLCPPETLSAIIPITRDNKDHFLYLYSETWILCLEKDEVK